MGAMLYGVDQEILKRVGILDRDEVLLETDARYMRFHQQWIAYQTEALKQKLREIGTSIENFEDDGFIVERKVWNDGHGGVSNIEFLIYRKVLVNAVGVAVKQPGLE